MTVTRRFAPLAAVEPHEEHEMEAVVGRRKADYV